MRLSRGFYSWNLKYVERIVSQNPQILSQCSTITSGSGYGNGYGNKYGCDNSGGGRRGSPTLQKACDMDRTSVSVNLIQLLIEEGIKQNIGGPEGRGGLVYSSSTYSELSPLQILVKRGSLEVLEFLVSHSLLLPVDVTDFHLLHLAATYGHVDIVSFLVDLNSDAVITPDKNGSLPIHCTCSTEHHNQQHGDDDMSTTSSTTAYTEAADYQDICTIRGFLLQEGIRRDISCLFVRGIDIMNQHHYHYHHQYHHQHHGSFQREDQDHNSSNWNVLDWFASEAENDADLDMDMHMDIEEEGTQFYAQATPATDEDTVTTHVVDQYWDDIANIIHRLEKEENIEIPILHEAIMHRASRYQIKSIIDRILNVQGGEKNKQKQQQDDEEESLAAPNHEYRQRLPIHLAAERGIKWSEGMEDIVEVDKAAVRDIDKVTGLFPFALAAASTAITSIDSTSAAPASFTEDNITRTRRTSNTSKNTIANKNISVGVSDATSNCDLSSIYELLQLHLDPLCDRG
jgi:hypothetical protein